jgi:hypothetical protein
MREDFYRVVTRPSIERNSPREIIEIRGKGNASEKRNQAAWQSKCPYLFFCDDDIILDAECLSILLDTLKRNRTAGYAYCDYIHISHPKRGTGIHHSRPFDAAALKQDNYISTMSLILRRVFPGFDETLERFQDWELYLHMLDDGIEGVYACPGVPLFTAYYDGNGITQRDGIQEAQVAIRAKYRLPDYEDSPIHVNA